MNVLDHIYLILPCADPDIFFFIFFFNLMHVCLQCVINKFEISLGVPPPPERPSTFISAHQIHRNSHIRYFKALARE